jgi:hypothetical protein
MLLNSRRISVYLLFFERIFSFSRLLHAIFGTWIGRILLGLTVGVVATAVVVGTVVPLELTKTSATEDSASQATNGCL